MIMILYSEYYYHH